MATSPRIAALPQDLLPMPTRRCFLATTTGALFGALGAAVVGRRAGAVDVSFLDEVQRQAVPLPSEKFPPSLLERADGTAIGSWDDWLPERERLRRAWLEFLGPWETLPVDDHFRVIADETIGGCRRRRIAYHTEPDEEVEAWLLEPAAARPLKGHPGAVVFHSTTDRTIDEPAGTGSGGSGDDDPVAIGTWLCRRGFVVLCPRCHLWNTSPAHRLDTAGAVARLAQRHPGATGMRKLLHDSVRAVDILAAIEGVDAARIVAAGHSLGAKETLYLAAFDERVRASVFSEGGIGIGFSNWHDPWYLGAAIRDPGFPLHHAQLLALALPRALLILGGEAGPGAADGDRSWGHVARALEVGRLREGRPRLGLLNHRGGHAIPAAARSRLLDWLATYADGAVGAGE